MLNYTLRRLSWAIAAVFFVATLTFGLLQLVPGGPFSRLKQLPPEVENNLKARYHLNDPVWKQYLDYLANLAQGDLGPSFKYPDRTVNELIAEGFPISAALGTAALVLALVFGGLTGIAAALYHRQWPDYLAMCLVTIGYSVPGFILAGLLMYLFADRLGWFPAALWGSPAQAVLPALALAAMPAAVTARFVRTGLLEELQQDYIRTARAKGLSLRIVVFRHALRNAILPLLTYLGPMVATILTGSFVVENVFAIPGLGQYFVNSITNRDYTVILGVTVFYIILLIGVNLLVDLAYAWADPRLKQNRGGTSLWT